MRLNENCNSFNSKSTFEYIYLPKLVLAEQFWSTICTNALLGEILSQYKLWIFKINCPLPICLLFTLEHCLLYQENNVFLAFIKVIVDITITPFSVVG